MFSFALVVAVAALARAVKQPDNPWCPAHNWTPEQTKVSNNETVYTLQVACPAGETAFVFSGTDKRGCYPLNPTYPVSIKQQDLTVIDTSGAVVSHEVKDHPAPLENFQIWANCSAGATILGHFIFEADMTSDDVPGNTGWQIDFPDVWKAGLDSSGNQYSRPRSTPA